jgi:hypothetical protein
LARGGDTAFLVVFHDRATLSRVWHSLVVRGNSIAEGIVFGNSTFFSRVKTQELRSSDDNICALFFVWRRRFLKYCFWKLYFSLG